jgi:putative phosphoesterase
MKIAALYDIHGNLPALEAVLSEVEQADANLILFGGDIAAGPMPRETLDLVMGIEKETIFIRGNADRYLVTAFDDLPLDDSIPPFVQDSIKWEAAQLDLSHRNFLDNLPETVTLSVDGLEDVLFCHGSPRSDEELITPETPERRLRAALQEVREHTVVLGHTHIQFKRKIDGVQLVNAGSVGMPYGEPGAYWATLGEEVQLHRTTYDFEKVANLMRKSEDPQAEEFADRHVSNPYSVKEVTEIFEEMSAARKNN